MTRNTLLPALSSADASRRASPDKMQQKSRCRTPTLLMLEDVRGRLFDSAQPGVKFESEQDGSPRDLVKVFEVQTALKVDESGQD